MLGSLSTKCLSVMRLELQGSLSGKISSMSIVNVSFTVILRTQGVAANWCYVNYIFIDLGNDELAKPFNFLQDVSEPLML